VQPEGGEGSEIPGEGARPYFFLSYARTPKRDPADKADPDRWVYRLYKDLCDAILQLTDARPAEAGFMDRENRVGAEWSPDLVNALKTCRVFVPLYSRRYFESDNCGREWFAFARREVTHRALGGDQVSTIVPALWTRVERDKLPGVAQQYQYDHADLGERYRTEGFYGLMKLQSYRSSYQRAVLRLAERIVEIGDRTAASPSDGIRHMQEKDFESLQSAFGPANTAWRTTDRLHITVLAQDTSTLPPGRANSYYGQTPLLWSPYQPLHGQPIASYASDLAEKCLGCRPLVGSFEEIAGGWTQDPPAAPSLCLVDAWVGLSDTYHEQLRMLEQVDVPWVTAVVLWNIHDPGLSTAESRLRTQLQEFLGRRLDSGPRRGPLTAGGIPTLDDLSQLLPDVITGTLRRFRRNAPVDVPDDSAHERPRLWGANRTDLGGSR
jgi:FxsC-like protein